MTNKASLQISSTKLEEKTKKNLIDHQLNKDF